MVVGSGPEAVAAGSPGLVWWCMVCVTVERVNVTKTKLRKIKREG